MHRRYTLYIYTVCTPYVRRIHTVHTPYIHRLYTVDMCRIHTPYIHIYIYERRVYTVYLHHIYAPYTYAALVPTAQAGSLGSARSLGCKRFERRQPLKVQRVCVAAFPQRARILSFFAGSCRATLTHAPAILTKEKITLPDLVFQFIYKIKSVYVNLLKSFSFTTFLLSIEPQKIEASKSDNVGTLYTPT